MRSVLWPARNDELLLRAALLEGEESIKAWREWRHHVSYEDLDLAQRRLLPLLYEKLRKLNVSDPDLTRYGQAARAFWIKNQSLFKTASDVLRELDRLNIESLVLKGMPLALKYYPQPGLRPMSDIDILVAPGDAAATAEFLLGNGWTCVNEYIRSVDHMDQFIAVRGGFNFRGPGHQNEIDLHWRLFKGYFCDSTPFWAAAQTLDFNGQRTKRLCPTDQLLHVCALGADWDIVRPIRWIPDATHILAGSEIDWDRLVEQACRNKMVAPLREALGVLQQLLGVHVPEVVLETLQSLPVDALSWMDYRLSAGRPIPLIGRPLKRYVHYRRTARSLGFGKYLKQFWAISSFYEVISWGIGLAWRDIRAMGAHKAPGIASTGDRPEIVHKSH